MRVKPSRLDRERAIAALAGRQHGVVARRQLAELGLTGSSIGRRLELGRLHVLHRGVYALGHRVLSGEAVFMAAVLAGGPGAVLSHRSAAELWAIRSSARSRPEITLPLGRRAGPRVQVHHSSLPPDERTTLRGVPVTTVSRTLLDLAAVLTAQRLEAAMREAEFRRLGDATSLRHLLERHPRRRGTGTLRAIIAAGHLDDGITRIGLEDSFVAFLDAFGLPRPKLNRHVEAAGRLIECDCVWQEERLIVELDGRAAHARRSAFEADRARDRALSVAGWRTVRVTSRQLLREADALAEDLGRLLEPGVPQSPSPRGGRTRAKPDTRRPDPLDL